MQLFLSILGWCFLIGIVDKALSCCCIWYSSRLWNSLFMEESELTSKFWRLVESKVAFCSLWWSGYDENAEMWIQVWFLRLKGILLVEMRSREERHRNKQDLVPLAALISRELKNEKMEKTTVRYGSAAQSRKGEDYYLIKTDCQRVPGNISTSFSVFGLFIYLLDQLNIRVCCFILVNSLYFEWRKPFWNLHW